MKFLLQISETRHNHPVLSRVVKYLLGGWPHDVEPSFDPFVYIRLERSIEKGQALSGDFQYTCGKMHM